MRKSHEGRTLSWAFEALETGKAKLACPEAYEELVALAKRGHDRDTVYCVAVDFIDYDEGEEEAWILGVYYRDYEEYLSYVDSGGTDRAWWNINFD